MAQSLSVWSVTFTPNGYANHVSGGLARHVTGFGSRHWQRPAVAVTEAADEVEAAGVCSGRGPCGCRQHARGSSVGCGRSGTPPHGRRDVDWGGGVVLDDAG